MMGYEQTYQKIELSLDFKQCSLKGSVRITLKLNQGHSDQNTAENVTHYILPIHLPIVEKAVYKSVMVNAEDACYHIVKVVNSKSNDEMVNKSFKNVDLMTLEGLHAAAQSLCHSFVYIEIPPDKYDLDVVIFFDYYDLDGTNSEIYFEKYWILPRGTATYKEYTVFVSGSFSSCWFPSLSPSASLKISKSCLYELEIKVPDEYAVVCGLPLKDDILEDVNEQETSRIFRFSSDGYTSDILMDGHRFGLFAGEFDFWDGVQSHRGEISVKDESIDSDGDDEMTHLTNGLFKMPKGSPITYLTLKGFGVLLESTNVATPLCIETYKRVLDLDMPSPLYLLFLPLHGFNNPANISSQIRTHTYIDIKRCSSYTGSESFLQCSFLDSLTQFYNDMYYKSGTNMLVYSMDCLHSFNDIDHDPKCIDKRIIIAYGISLLFTKMSWDCATRDLHLDLMLQSYVVDQYIRRNFGVTELKLRLWAKRELFATITELFGDSYPLCREGEEAYTSSHVLLNDRAFVLKCHLVSNALESLFSNASFLPDGFFVQLLRRRIMVIGRPGDSDGMDGSKTESEEKSHWESGSTFWKILQDEIIRRYIIAWNAKPQNRLVMQNQLHPNSKFEDIIKRGVEHEQLNTVIKNFNNLKSSFIYGTGCPQINMGIALQLQRKGTSMDQLLFRVDIKSLQPPLDVSAKGKSLYSLCQVSGVAAENLLSTYTQLNQIMQLYESQTDSVLHVFERVLKLYGIDPGIRCVSSPQLLDFGEVTDSLAMVTFSEVGQLRKKMAPFQAWHDSVDLIGRDGNFAMGFGYIGAHALQFCLGSGPIWDCLEVLKQSCEVNKILDTLVDNGGTYCGVHIHSKKTERQLNKGRLPIATSGGFPYWQMVNQQKILLENLNSAVSLSSGFAKQWIILFKVDIVEDDGVREHIKRIGDLVPSSYKVNPRAERGRKKVAIKGIVSAGSGVVGVEKAHEETIVADEGGKKNLYIGHHSESDRMVIDWMKMLYIGMHPEMAQLDNRSVVARVCSKTRLPLLWLRVDSGFSLIARIRRCQSSGMWEQQLMSDNNVYSQMEAAVALGSFGRSEQFISSESPIVYLAANKLEQMIRRHRVHPLVRSRCLYSLVCLHNRNFRQGTHIQGIFSNYFNSFSLNSSCNSLWHPSEARFMLDFFKAIALLRDKQGYSPQMCVDIFVRVLEGMSGPNYLIHATNIVESSSYLAIPPCIINHVKEKQERCLQIERLWSLMWHLFRLDGIPGSCSCNRMLTSAFLICLSRQPVFLSLCSQKFEMEKDLGFKFDYLYFIPLSKHVNSKNQAIFELGQTYNSRDVHLAAIRSTLYVLLTGSFILENTYTHKKDSKLSDANCNGTGILKMKKISFNEQSESIRNFKGVLEAAICCIELFERLKEWSLKLYVWEAFGEVLVECSQSMPILFCNIQNQTSKKARDLLFDKIRPFSISSDPFAVQMFLRMRFVISVLYGHGYNWDTDTLPDPKLPSSRLSRLQCGLSMPRIAAFRRIHGDTESGSSEDWLEVACEAVQALKELPQARWYIADPEKSYSSYKSIVKQPMWLDKIEQKAKDRHYAIPMEFKADIALLFKNAKAFNKADTLPFKDVLVVEEQFDSLWPAIVKTYQRNAKVQHT